jgi:glyoxylase-like metal-dependent hydrolase (beta-lactamase superfamily II)
MLDVEEIAERIYRLETPVPGTPYAPVVYLITESDGVLIEPGPSYAIPLIREGMEHLGMNDLAYIIPTHFHLDHAGGAGELAQLFPRAKVVIHPRGAKHALDPSQFIKSTKMVWGDDFETRFGPITPVRERQLQVPEDGEIINVNGRELEIIYAPGHAPHQIVILDRKVKGLFCAEALGLPWHHMPPVAPPRFDLETYLETIERLKLLDTRMLFVSHGGLELEPEKIIARAAESAVVCRDIILSDLKQGLNSNATRDSIADYVTSSTGLQLTETDLLVIIGGYTMAFQSMGLV